MDIAQPPFALLDLGGYLYWIELPAKETEEKQAVTQQALLSFPESDIAGLSVTTPQGSVEMKRNEAGAWMITAPLQTEADTREVQAMIRALVTGKILRTIEDKPGTLAAFGLEQRRDHHHRHRRPAAGDPGHR